RSASTIISSAGMTLTSGSVARTKNWRMASSSCGPRILLATATMGTAMDVELDGQVFEAHRTSCSLQRGTRRTRGGELQVAAGEVTSRTANTGAANMVATTNTIHPTLNRDRTADPGRSTLS